MASSSSIESPKPDTATEGRELEITVSTLKEKMGDMPLQMRAFSLSLRSLYIEKAVGSNEEPAVKFRELRDDTRNDAMVYLKFHLPLSLQFVRSIKEFFEYFLALTFEDWKDPKILSDIKAETVGYNQICKTLLQAHEDLMIPLKKRRDKASEISNEFEHLQSKYQSKIKELQASADFKKQWALGLMTVPYVNVIACPLLNMSASMDAAEATASETQAEINAKAAILVSNTLIPALGHFIEGLSCAAAFFMNMHQDLNSFEKKAEQSLESRKMIYFKVMQKEANNMNDICRNFYSIIPEVRTDLKAIPSTGTDQNYVDRWLEKQKKQMEEKCTMKSIYKLMLKAISSE